MEKKKQQEYCFYKEHWFGATKEAQEKPSGFRYKRGTLLKIKNAGFLSQVRHQRALNSFNPYGRQLTLPKGFTKDTIALIYDYDSELGKIREWNEVDDKYEYVETVKHTFKFLFDGRWDTVTLEVWGYYKERNFHNQMWHKARKQRKLPKKKRKSFGSGFSFDDYMTEETKKPSSS